MVTLTSLFKVAPFDEETRKTVLDKLAKNELSDSQKLQFSSLCWEMIAKLYETELALKIQDMMREVAEGTKTYTKSDYKEEEVRLVHRFATELEAANSQESLEEVRKKLADYSAQKPPQV